MTPAAVVFPSDRWYEIDTPADLSAAELVFAGSGRAARTWRPEPVATWSAAGAAL